MKNQSKHENVEGKTKKLSVRQELFAKEYMSDLNATQAYIRAGYSENGASQSAEKLLRNPEMQKYINKLQTERATRCEIKADNVLKELAAIGMADLSKLYRNDGSRAPIDELNEETRQWVGIRPADKLKALELLGKHLGVFEKDNAQRSRPYEHLSEEELRAKIKEMEKRVKV